MDWASTEFIKLDQAGISVSLNGEPRVGYQGTGINPAYYAIERCMAVLGGLYFLHTRRHAGTLDAYLMKQRSP